LALFFFVDTLYINKVHDQPTRLQSTRRQRRVKVHISTLAKYPQKPH